MVVVCQDCRETYSGGHTCASCGGKLLDVANPEVRREYLEDPELAYSIRLLYQARRGMVLLFLGILGGLALFFACVQKGWVADAAWVRYAWYTAGGLLGLLTPVTGLVLANRIVKNTKAMA